LFSIENRPKLTTSDDVITTDQKLNPSDDVTTDPKLNSSDDVITTDQEIKPSDDDSENVMSSNILHPNDVTERSHETCENTYSKDTIIKESIPADELRSTVFRLIESSGICY